MDRYTDPQGRRHPDIIEMVYVDGEPLGEFTPRDAMDAIAASRRRHTQPPQAEPVRAIPPLPFKHRTPHDEPSR